MNEQKYELAKQAGLYHKTTLIESAVPLDQMLDKFAELIVRECIDIVKPTPHHEAYPQCYLGDVDGLILLENKVKKIKEYFGVEE